MEEITPVPQPVYEEPVYEEQPIYEEQPYEEPVVDEVEEMEKNPEKFKGYDSIDSLMEDHLK